jgi:type I restriction enzyme S subunit
MSAREELPVGWTWATLGDLVDRLQYGYTAQADPKAKGPRFLRITDLREEGISWSEVPGCFAASEDVEKFALRDGDVVFARTGSIEKAAVVRNPPEAIFASYLIRGRPLTPILSDWIGRFVRSSSYLQQIGAAGAGIGRENVNATKLAAVRIPVAPECEQRRILAKLDALLASSSASRAKLDALPALFELYGHAVLSSAFEGRLTNEWRQTTGCGGAWELRPLAEVTHRITDGTHQPPPLAASGIPFITIGDITGTRLDWERVSKWVTPETHAKLTARCVPERGDVLYTAVGATFGRAVHVDWDQPFVFQRHIAHIKPQRDVLDPEFLAFMLNAPFTYGHARAVARGAAQPTVTLGDLRKFVIPVPTMDEQREVVRRVSEALAVADHQLATVKALRPKLNVLDSAILRLAFSGRLVPQDPADEPAAVLLERLQSERAPASQRRRHASLVVSHT